MMGGLQYGFATHKEGLRPDVISYGRTGNEKYYDRSTGKQISKEEYDERVQNHGVRQEMAEAWESLMDKLNKSDYATRSRAYDDLHNGSYWSKGTEMGARAFAVWVENKLSEQNAHNDYLANNPHLTKEQIEQSSLLAGVFPYPFDEDAEWMNEGFGNLFEVMQEKVEENNAVLYQVANEVLSNTTEAQKLATEAVLAALGKAGVEVIEATPEMVDAIMNESGAEMQVLNGKLSALEKAAKTIKMWVERGVRGKSFILSLPLKTQNMVRVAMGRDFDTHNITANGISHALKNHGENGIKLKGNSIPIKKEDTTLIPYIMTAPDRVEKGSTDASGRESIRFYKDLSNGYVVVVEKEYKNSPDDMETINIWAEMSSKATNAQRVAAPDIDVQNAILSTDVAKIREDAEKAIREDVKRNAKTPQFHRVYHGSGTLFDEFDHSFIGTGEGHQAFGWGTYVTEVQSIGESYANKLSKPVFLYKGERVDTESFSSPYRVMADLYHATNGKLTEMRAMAKKYASSSREFGSEAADLWDDVLSILNETRRGDIKISKGKVLYTVEIPNDIDGNYIEYDASVGEGTVEKVGAEMESKYGLKFSHKMEGNGAMVYEKDGEKVVLNPKASGADLYEELSDALGGAKEASSFLSEVGFTGISYQAEHLSGGRADGAKNYVIFNEKDLQIKDVVEMMRTPQGTVYGWTVGGKIYLTPAGMNANTPIHEYTHLWANAMMQKNPRGWESVKNLLKGTPVWDAVIKDEAYADIRSNEDLVASEVLSRISGRENARKMEAEAQKMIDEANGVVGKANAVTLLSRMKEALQKFWNWVGKDLFGIESFDSIEEVTDRVLYDLVSGTDLKRGVAAEENVLYRTSTEIDEQYPNWLEGTTTDSGKHSTQVEGTRKTYNKVGDWIEGNMGKEVSILDASSGLGYGTMDLRERGFNIEDVEPYQSEQRKQENPATYSSYGDIEKQYDVIISNAVLNVIPDDWRANVLHDMADRLKAGGMMFINTRKAGEEKNIKDKIELDNSREVLVKRNGKIASYQKFFTPTELKEWVENELGAGYTVAIANEANSGTKGLAAVVVYKTDSKRYREWTDEQRAEYSAQKGIVEEVERVAATMGEAVEFVTAEQMPKGKEKAKGYYNPRTGKVVINVSAHTSSWDACRTAFHEIVGHKGLRAMLKGGFNDFLDSVYKGMGWRVRSGIDREAAKYIAKGESETEARRHATEEYVARMAEEGFVPRNRSVWNKIADALKYALMNAKIRLGFSLSDRDVRYALWRTYDMLTHKGVIGQARDIAMREKEGIGVAEDQNRYRDVDDVVDRTLNAWYDNEVKSFGHKLREGYQDGMLALKKVQEQIAKQTGRPLADYEDAYTAENQATSISKEEQFWYTERYFKPMMNAVTSLMSAANMTYDEVVKYVLAKSGIERNSTLAWRDTIDAYAEKLAEDGATPEEINEKVADAIKREAEAVEAIRVAMGGKRDAEYYKKVDKARADIIPEYKDYRKNDYAGLTSLMETQGEKSAAKKAEAKAMDVVNAVEGRCVDECNTLWESIKEATRATLRKSYVSGMMSQEQYNKVLQMFEFYVPMRGWSEDTASDVYDYVTQKAGGYNATLKKAEGRKSVADDPFATIGNMADSAIVGGNKNMVKQKFLSMAVNRPTSLFTVGGVWYEQTADGKWEESTPTIPKGATAEQVADAVKAHEDKMRALKAEGKAYQKSDKPHLAVKATKREMSEHAVRVRRGGTEYIVYVNGDPRIAQAINGVLTDRDKSTLEKLWGKFNRFLAANFTTRNPTFVLRNMSRDIMFATTAVSVKEDKEYLKKFIKNGTKALNIWNLLSLYKAGELDMSKEQHRYFKEFMEHGGETGYTAINDVDAYKREIAGIVAKAQGRTNFSNLLGVNVGWSPKLGVVGNAADGMESMVKMLALMNRGAEDISRFATYMTSRQMGRSVQKSIADAKDITVNFNRKGNGAMGADTFRLLYLFFNAGVQGMHNIAKMLKHNTKKAVGAIAVTAAMGYAIPMLNELIWHMMGGDDDQENMCYNDLPEWVRRNNIVFKVGYDRWLTIPLSLELRPIYGIGDIAIEWAKGDIDTGEASNALLSQMMAISPLDFTGGGSDVVMNLMPDILKPVAQAYVNEDYFGKPIYKDTPYNKNAPEYTKAYKSTSDVMVEMAEFLNDISGGDEVNPGAIDLNPAQIEHVIEGYLGGVGKTINQTGKTISMMWEEDKRMWRNVPVLNAFITEAGDVSYKLNNLYFKYLNEAEKTLEVERGYRKKLEAGDESYTDKYNELIGSEKWQKANIVKAYKKQITKLNSIQKEQGASDEITDMMTLLKAQMIEEVKAVDTTK